MYVYGHDGIGVGGMNGYEGIGVGWSVVSIVDRMDRRRVGFSGCEWIWMGIGAGWRVVSIVDRRDRRVNKSGWEWI